MVSESSEKGGAFKISDKRRFDMQGNERSGEEILSSNEDSTRNFALKSEKEKQEKLSSPSHHKQGTQDTPEINFSSFVLSLATQVLMQLGELKPPNGLEVTVDRVGAKQTIDILNMLQQKSKGNLDKEESHLIEEILHSVKLAFVKAGGA